MVRRRIGRWHVTEAERDLQGDVSVRTVTHDVARFAPGWGLFLLLHLEAPLEACRTLKSTDSFQSSELVSCQEKSIRMAADGSLCWGNFMMGACQT